MEFSLNLGYLIGGIGTTLATYCLMVAIDQEYQILNYLLKSNISNTWWKFYFLFASTLMWVTTLYTLKTENIVKPLIVYFLFMIIGIVIYELKKENFTK